MARKYVSKGSLNGISTKQVPVEACDFDLRRFALPRALRPLDLDLGLFTVRALRFKGLGFLTAPMMN